MYLVIGACNMACFWKSRDSRSKRPKYQKTQDSNHFVMLTPIVSFSHWTANINYLSQIQYEPYYNSHLFIILKLRYFTYWWPENPSLIGEYFIKEDNNVNIKLRFLLMIMYRLCSKRLILENPGKSIYRCVIKNNIAIIFLVLQVRVFHGNLFSHI